MIIVLKPNTSDKDIARVEHQIKRNGLDTHIVRGQEMTIIGCSETRLVWMPACLKSCFRLIK